MDQAAPLRILISRAAAAKWGLDIARVLETQTHSLVHPGDADAELADIAFISRDVTGLSTKHETLPATQQFYATMRRALQLRWAHIHSAGTDRPIYLELMQRGVLVTNSSGANASVVAQTAVLGVLALARHWPQLIEAQHERRWASLIGSGLPRDIEGQTAVIIGWGPVGREIARLLQALGMTPIVVRRSGLAAAPEVQTVSYARLHEVLSGADWLILACPLSDETRQIVSRQALALLPAHACLVNVARGDVIDEESLIEALREKRIRGAYLDVFAHEPLPADSPLWSMPGVIVTPHSAGMSDANERHVARMFFDNLRRWSVEQLLLVTPP